MKKQTGIWLDKEKAYIISLHEKNYGLKKIASEIETRERVPGEGKQFGRFGDQQLNPEKTKERRLKEQTTAYLKTLEKEVNATDEIVLFGPAEMKTELDKHLRKKNDLAQKIKAVKAADSMTENQMAAWVREFFSEN